MVSVAGGPVLNYEANTSHELVVRVTDGAGLSKDQTIKVRVADVNEAPVATDCSITMAEDSYVNFRATTMGSVQFDDGLAPAVRIDTLPSQGVMTLFGQPLAVGQMVKVDDVENIEFKQNLFNLQSFGYTDVDSGDSIQGVRIDTLPSHGQLGLNGYVVESGQIIAVADLQNLVFKPVHDFNGATSFSYSMQDAAGAFSPAPGTFTINVTPVNDTPIIDQVVSQDVREGGLTRLEGLHFSDADAGSNAVTVKLHVNAGIMRSNGTSLVQVEGDGSDTIVLTGALGDINDFVANGDGVHYGAPQTYAKPEINSTIERLDAQADPAVRIVMNATQGTFNANERAGIMVTGNGTGTLTVVGRASVLSDYLEHDVTHSQAAQSTLLQVRINDNGNAGEDPGLTGEANNEKAYSFTSLLVVPEGHDLRASYVAGSPDNGPGLSATTIAGMAVGTPLLLAGTVGANSGIRARTIEEFFKWLSEILCGAPTADEPPFTDETAVELVESSDAEYSQFEAVNDFLDAKEILNDNDSFDSSVDSPLNDLTPPTPPTTPTTPPTTPPLPPAVPFIQALSVLLGLGLGVILPLVLTFKPSASDTHVNEAPTIELPGSSLDVYQGEATVVKVRFDDTDVGDNLMKVKMWAADGTLQAVSSGGVTVTTRSGVNSDGVEVEEVNLAGTLSDLNAFIEAGKLTYTADLLATGPAQLHIVVSDSGGRGVDPGAEGQGGTGGTDDEQGSATYTLNILEVNHAPESGDATITVKEHQPHVFTMAEFPFAESVDSNNQLAGIKITALPGSGQLTVYGVPLFLVNGVAAFVSAQDIADGKFVFTPANSGTPQDSTSFTFEVQDDGGTAHGGKDTSAPHTMSLNVDHAPVLALDESTFNEAQQPKGQLATDVVITDVDTNPAGITTVNLTVTQPHAGDSWAVDMVRFADAYQQLGAGGTPPTVNIASTGENSYALTFSGENGSTAVSIAVAQALIDSLVFHTESPNMDEGTREFMVQIVDEYGVRSNAALASVQVTSTFGEIERAIEASKQVIAGFVSQPTTVSVDSFASDQQQGLMEWIHRRGELADAVRKALSKAPVTGGVVELGGSLTEALDVLGVDYDKRSANPSIDVSEQPGALFADAERGTVRLSEEYRFALLMKMGELRESMRLSQYAEVVDALAEAVQGDGTADEWQVPNAAWLVSWLNSVGVTQTGQLATDASGTLSATKETFLQLLADLDQHRVAEMGKHSPYVEMASYLLTQCRPEGGVWTVDSALLDLLDKLGIEHQAPAQLASGANLVQNLLAVGSLAYTSDGKLAMSPMTIDKLTRSLADAMADGKGIDSPVSGLLDLLQAATATNGIYTLTAQQAQLLQDSGVSFRAVEALSGTPLAGEVSRSGPDAPVFFNESTRASLLAQLSVLQLQADPLQAEGGAVGDLLPVLESLQRAVDTSFYGKPLQQVGASDDLLEMLVAQGFQIDDFSNYTQAQRDAIVPGRVESESGLLQVFKLDGALFMAPAAVSALTKELSRELQDIGLDLGTRSVLPAEQTQLSDFTPLETAHQRQAEHPSLLPLTDAMALVNDTAHALSAMLRPSSSQTLNGAASTQIPGMVVDIDPDLFTAMMASAGIEMKNLGPVGSLDAAGASSLGDAAQLALTYTADGSLVLSQATIDALRTKLNAQYFHERADLAHSAMAALLHDDPDAHLNILNEADNTLRDAPASTAGVGLAVVDAQLLPTLVQLGISLTLQSRTSQPTTADVDALQSNEGRFVIDEAHQTLIMSEGTRTALLRQVAAQMQASQVTAYTIDPQSIADARYAGNPQAAAYNPIDAAAVQDALTHAVPDVVHGLVRVDVDEALLARLHLGIADAGNFDGSSAAAATALLQAKVGTVQHDADDGKLVMSVATHTLLQTQLELVQDAATGASPLDPATVVGRMAEVNQLLNEVRVGVSIDDDGFVYMRPDSDLLSRIEQVLGITITDLGAFDSAADPATYALAAQANTAAHTTDGWIVVSTATQQAWTSQLSAAAAAVGGDLEGSHQFDPKDEALAVVNWQARSESVGAFDAIEAQLTPLLVGSNFEDFTSSSGVASLWRVAADAGLTIASLAAQLGGLQLTDLGALDTHATSTIDALLEAPYGIVRQPGGSLLMSPETRQDIVDALAGRLADARQAVCAHAVDELLAAREEGGRLVLEDNSLVQDLMRLGLGGSGRLVSGDAPEFGELAVNGRSEVTLTELTRLHLLSQIGAVESLHVDVNADDAAALLDALRVVTTSPNGIVAVPAGAGLALADGWLSLRDGGAYADTALGRGNLRDAPLGTVQHGADGTLHMSNETMSILLAELDGVKSNGKTTGSLSPDSGNYLQAAAETLTYLGQLDKVHDGDTPWWQTFKSWVFEPVGNAQQHAAGLSGGLLDQAEMFGLQLNELHIETEQQLSDAISQGQLRRANTVVIDAEGNVLMAPETRKSLVGALLEQVHNHSGVDWSEYYGDGTGGINAFAASLGLLAADEDTAVEGLKRNVTATASNANWLELQANANTLLAMLQLDNQTAALGGNTYGTNLTADTMRVFQDALVYFGLDDRALVRDLTGATLDDGHYAVDGGKVVMTTGAWTELLHTAQQAVALSGLQAERDMMEVFGTGDRLDGSLLQFDTSTLPASYEHILALSELTLKDAFGVSHGVDAGTLIRISRAAQEADDLTSFRNESVKYVVDGVTIDTTNGAMLDLYVRLTEEGDSYALTKDGAGIVMSSQARHDLLAAATKHVQVASASLAEMASDSLGQAEDYSGAAGVKKFPAGAILTLLDALGIPHMVASNSATVFTSKLPNAVYISGATAYVSADTYATLQERVDAIVHHSTAAASKALDDVVNGTVVVGDGDLFHQNSRVEAMSAVAHDATDKTAVAKTVVSVHVSADTMQAFVDKQFISAWSTIGSLSAATQDQFDALWSSGKIASATAGGQTVFVMSEETLAELESKITDAGTAVQWGLRAVDASLIDDLIGAGIKVSEARYLLADGQSHTRFTDATQLDRALNDASPGTVFVDDEGNAWISGDTAALLQTQLGAALHAKGSPAMDIPGSVSAQLQAYDALTPIFNGKADSVLITKGPGGTYEFDLAHIGEVQSLGIDMNQIATTASLSASPVSSYQIVDGKAVIDARTYAAISAQLPVQKFALESSLFQNEWQKVSYVGSDGQTHVYWRSAGQGDHFADALTQAKLPLAKLPLEGLSLDTLSGSMGYMIDGTGHVLVSDDTHARIEPVLELATLVARKSFADSVGAALHNAATHDTQPLVLITDPTLVDQIRSYKSNAISFSSFGVDSQNLTEDGRAKLSSSATYFFGNDGDTIVMSVATRDAWASVMGGIPELSNAGTPMAAVPDVVEVKSTMMTGFLQSQFGLSLGNLHDASSAVIAPSSIDADTLSDSGRRELEATHNLVVADKNGNLLMSRETWASLSATAERAIAVAGHDLSSTAEELISAGTAIQVRNGDLVELAGDASNWIEMFRAAGVPYELVNGLLDAAGNASWDLFSPATPGTFAVGINAAGHLVMSKETASDLGISSAYATDIYAAAQSASLSSPGMLELPASTDHSAYDSSLYWRPSTYSSVTASATTGYTTVTRLRYMLNSGIATDTSIVQTHYESDVLKIFKGFNDLTADAKKEWLAQLSDYYIHNKNLLPPGYDIAQMQSARSAVGVLTQNILTNQLEDKLQKFKQKAYEILDDIGDLEGSRLPAGQVRARLDELAEAMRSLSLGTESVIFSATKIGQKADVLLSHDDEIEMQVVTKESAVENRITALKTKLERILTAGNDINDEDYDAFQSGLNSAIEKSMRSVLKDIERLDHQSEATWDALEKEVRHSDKVKTIANQQKADLELSNGLQAMRFYASIGNTANIVTKWVDAYQLNQQAQAVLGNTAEAEQLRDLYTFKASSKAFGGVQTLFSASQLFGFYGFFKDPGTLAAHTALAKKLYPADLPNPFFNKPDRTSLMEWIKNRHPKDALTLWPLADANLKHNLINVIYQAADWSGAVSSLLDVAENGKTIQIKGPSYSTIFPMVTGIWGATTGFATVYSDGIGWFSVDRGLSGRASIINGISAKGYYALAATDLVYQTVQMGLTEGANWGAFSTALYGSTVTGLSLLGVLTPVQILVASWILAPNFISIQNAYEIGREAKLLEAEGRTVEAQHNNALYYSEAIRGFGGVLGALAAGIYDLIVQPNTWTRTEYEKAATERLATLDAEGASNRPIDAAVALAAQWGVSDMYLITGNIVDFGPSPNPIQVVKAGVAHHVVNGVSGAAQIAFYDASVNITGTDDNFSNKAPLKMSADNGVDLSNRTGHAITYVIAPAGSMEVEGSHQHVSTANLEIDVSGSSADSVNHFVVYNPNVVIRGGAGIDLYFLLQALTPIFDSQGNRVAGFISDGIQSRGLDLVSFKFAESTDTHGGGYTIQSGIGYSGASAYDGIYAFEGSAFDDHFTRYGGSAADVAEVSYGSFGGVDTFDLRSGNNTVELASGGVVHFNLTDKPAEDLLPDTLPLQAYNTLFQNYFSSANSNWVEVSNAAGGGWFEIYGHNLATDVVSFSAWSGAGLSFTKQGSPATVNGHEVSAGDYVVTDLLDSTKAHGFFSADVDQLYGTSQADKIEVDGASKLKQFVGNGGADEITIDKDGFSVVEGAGNAIITLEDGASNATVYASSGNAVSVKAIGGANDVVTIHMAGTTSEPAVIVDGGEAFTDLRAVLTSGNAKVSAGWHDSTIVINADADKIEISDNVGRKTGPGKLNIEFLDAAGNSLDDNLFDVSQLYFYEGGNKVAGFKSELLADGVTTQYDTTWHSASGHDVAITLYSRETDLSLGAYNETGTGLTTLDNLIAWPQPQPAPVPA
ncbi:Ig-like domain-containing protein [Variovorax sp. JS1663]|uniref:Ig-like domain-containing protein n=1 Tax=Variovorax sp. JS1663 TaxID=1851577 RepID=UPI001EE0EE63|nr:Ig-like domain-containing protein [Variovorax sp. JS1663]